MSRAKASHERLLAASNNYLPSVELAPDLEKILRASFKELAGKLTLYTRNAAGRLSSAQETQLHHLYNDENSPLLQAILDYASRISVRINNEVRIDQKNKILIKPFPPSPVRNKRKLSLLTKKAWKLDVNTLADAIIEEVTVRPDNFFNNIHGLPHRQWIPHLLERHKQWSAHNSARAELTQESALTLPPKFLDTVYGGKYTLYNLTTKSDLTLEGILNAHCVGSGGWNEQIVPKNEGELPETLILSFSETLDTPKTLQEIIKDTDRSVEYLGRQSAERKAYTTTRLPVITIEYNATTGRIGQVKMAGNEKFPDAPENPLYKAFFAMLRDLNEKLSQEPYRGIRSFGSDLKHLKKNGRFLTIFEEQKKQEELKEGDVLVAGDTLKLDHTATPEQLFTYCSLSNITLNCTDIFKNPSLQMKEAMKKVRHIRGALKYTSAEPLALGEYFPNLERMTALDAPNTTTLTLNLPKLERMEFLIASKAKTLILELPELLQMGSLYANNTTTLSLKLPELTEMGNLIASTAITLVLNLPKLEQLGNLSAFSATTVTLDLPKLRQMEYLNAQSATAFSLNLPELKQMADLNASNVITLALNLPELVQMGVLSAISATTLTLDLPKLERLGNIDANSATTLTLDLPKLERLGNIDANSATSIILDLPELTKMGYISAHLATVVTLKLPKLIEMGYLNAESAATLTLDLEELTMMGTLNASSASIVTLNLPKVTQIAHINAPNADTLTLEIPKINKMGSFYIRDGQIISSNPNPYLQWRIDKYNEKNS